jgi:hypothetical protein
MEISISDLKVIVDELMKYLDSFKKKGLQLSDDYYWDVPWDVRYEMSKKPQELSVGQLSDDWKDLLALMNNEKEIVLYNFVDLASILRKIGEMGEASMLSK